jgi:ribosomal protein S4
MSVFLKYKQIPKLRSFQYNFPKNRILKFKKGKWKFLKKQVLRRGFKKIKFYNFSKILVRKRRFEKLNYYRFGLNFKISYLYFFNHGLSLKNLKAFAKEKNRFEAFFVKPFFKLDILLWKLKFFTSVREAQQYITNNFVLVNGAHSSQIKQVQKGDVITLTTKLKSNRGVFNSQSFLFAFCEVDYYTKTVVILKDFKNCIKQDISLLYRKHLEDDILQYYVSKK